MRHPPKTTARARVMVSGSSCGGAARNPPANPNPIASANGQMIDAIVDGWMEKREDHDPDPGGHEHGRPRRAGDGVQDEGDDLGGDEQDDGGDEPLDRRRAPRVARAESRRRRLGNRWYGR